MFARFFDSTEVDGFAEWLAAELFRAMPPGQVGSEARQAARRLAQLDAKMADRLQALQTTKRLGVYQKARLGTRLREALASAGYPDAFARDFVMDVVTRLASPVSRPPG